MYFLGLGLILGVLKYLEIQPAADLSWMQVGIPFGLAVVWWTWADRSGYTKRKVVEREAKLKKERIDKQRDVLGLRPTKKK